jgi:hypothetical protein
MAAASHLNQAKSEAARAMHTAIRHSVMERCPDLIQTEDTYETLSLNFPQNGIKLKIRILFSPYTNEYINILYFENLSHVLCLLPTTQFYQAYYELGYGIRLIPTLGRSEDTFGHLANAILIFVGRQQITKQIKCHFGPPSGILAPEGSLSVCFSVQPSEKEFIMKLIQALYELQPVANDML